MQLEPAGGGEKKASKLSDLEPPSPSLKLVVRHRDTSFKWGPSGFDKRIFCQSSCARDLGFFFHWRILGSWWHGSLGWWMGTTWGFKNSALHFMSLSSLEGEMASLVGKMPLLVGYLSWLKLKLQKIWLWWALKRLISSAQSWCHLDLQCLGFGI